MSLKPLWHLHPHVRAGGDLMFRERAADVLKNTLGTWSALGTIAAVIVIWISTGGFGGDSAPFILLNLCLSCLAAVQGIVLQIAANRGDRQSSELALHTFENGQKILDINQQQMQILTELRALREDLHE